ncbi:MAG: DNA polymerase III subunit delta' [Alphaproteobacteria bacterium]|nr:DNA polymerase III subunit delta' [Alphaproteobacteria bacterium]
MSDPGEFQRAPRANPDLIGHEAAEATLLSAWNSDKLPHAWLIAGPRGIGKATLAYRFARFVLAEGAKPQGDSLFGAPAQPSSIALSPADPIYRRVASGGHSDMSVAECTVHPKTGKMRSEIPVDDVRGVVQFLHMTPAEGAWRVVVVDAADEMNTEGANALLKALEEPPPQALLLLVTHAAGRLLPTIRSRCRMLFLQPLPEAKVVTLLSRYRPEIPSDERAVLASLSDGSIGRAMDLADRGGAELYREVLALVADLPKLDALAVQRFADQLARGGEDAAASLRTALDLMGGLVHRLAKSAAGQPAALPEEHALAARAAARGAQAWVQAWERIGRLGSAAEGLNLDRKQTILAAFGALQQAAA